MPDKTDLAKVQGYIPPEWKAAIKEITKESGLSESAQVKLALEMYLKTKGKLKN
ncbi:hypothetical protein [Brevibacillus thermoruber]|jgi:hypothetical protein|uniref:hypothetical protein n=1 Tax=Brevibacillus thermoruber TaxID=33942 RepID=UPI0012E075A9|nr:hypothetical protein [Brevibacillus thermoruber]